MRQKDANFTVCRTFIVPSFIHFIFILNSTNIIHLKVVGGVVRFQTLYLSCQADPFGISWATPVHRRGSGVARRSPFPPYQATMSVAGEAYQACHKRWCKGGARSARSQHHVHGSAVFGP